MGMMRADELVKLGELLATLRNATGESSHVAEAIEESIRVYQKGRLDHFAAAALTGYMTGQLRTEAMRNPEGVSNAELTKAAWDMARAMLDNEPKDES
jgi:hypothetical protein